MTDDVIDDMTHYEIATLSTVIFGAAKAAPAIRDWVAGGAGRLLGAFASDIGALNSVILLRGFGSLAEMMDERERALRSDNAFGCAEHLVALAMDSYRGLDVLPPVEPGALGPVYELRTYPLRLGGLMPTMAKWREAVPGREAYSRLAFAGYALDGTPRLTQLWPYASLAARAAARAASVADGKWPPKGGPDWLSPAMTSQIILPLAFSPLT